MKSLLPLLLLALSIPAAANTRGAAHVTQQLNEKGAAGYIGQLCEQLNGVPVWGGVTSSQRQITEMSGQGVRLTCGANGRVNKVVLTPGFQGPVPQDTTFDMNYRQVWRTIKRAGYKNRTIRNKNKAGSTILLNRSTKVTWTFADKKGKNGVKSIELNK